MGEQKGNRLRTALGIENLQGLGKTLRQIKVAKETIDEAQKALAELAQENSFLSRGLSCVEAGRLGGITNLTKNGVAALQSAGRKGQRVLMSKYSVEDRRRWGRMGGRPRKKHYTGEEGSPRQRRNGEPAQSFSLLPPPAV